MKRKMVYIGLSYIFGLFFASFLNTAFYAALLMLAVVIIILLFARIKLRSLTVCVIAFLLAVTVYMGYDSLVYRKILGYEGQNVWLSGRIVEINDYADDKSSYLIDGRINGEQSAKVLCYLDSADCRYGDEITIEGTFKGFENTYLFDAEDYYRSQNIFLQLDEAQTVSFEKRDGFGLIRSIYAYREKISHEIKLILPNEEGDFLAAMLFGDRGGLEESTQTSLYRSGIGHVMAVSGLHLMIISAFLMWLLQRTRLSRRLSFFIVEAVILLFVICTGAGISVIRAAIMLTVVNSAALFRRQGDTLNSLCIAMLGLTAFSPFIIRSPSFLLSCSGVFGIGVLAPYLTEDIKGRLAKSAASMLCVSAAVFPVSLMFFEETSLIAPLANMLLLPLCMLALILAFITVLTGGVAVLAYPMLLLSGICVRLVLAVTDFLGRLEYTHISLGRNDLTVIAVVMLFFAILSYAIFRKPRTLALTIALSIPLLMANTLIYRLANKDILTAAVLGKGKNVAIVVLKGNNADIIDLCGGVKTSSYIKKYLSANGISHVNNLIIADNPYQSVSSYNNALELYSVGNVLIPEGTLLPENTEICGCKPEYDAFADISLSYSDYVIRLSDGVLTVEENEFSMLCFTGEMDFTDKAYSAAVQYGDYCASSLNCGYCIITDESYDAEKSENLINENNVEIRSADGNVQVRRLSDGGG